MFGEMPRATTRNGLPVSGSAAEGAAVRQRLRKAWLEDRFDDELARLASRFGSFDPEALFFGHEPSYSSSDDYEQFVYSHRR